MENAGAAQYWLTRFCFQRGLGIIYLIAFLIAANQFLPLLGERGLLPVRLYLERAEFWDAPSLFWINCSDRFITAVIWCGLALSTLAVTGLSDRFGIVASVAVWALLWMLYLSLVNVGQTFYGFGWEIILLESGFLAIFLGSSDVKPPAVVMWLLLWILFRIMFGAGMIKLRGDPCWRDLTCMFYHYETQPLPNPLSWYLHRLPGWMHKSGTLFNHFVELVVPWFLFAPRPLCYVAGGLTILFQVILILSGNLSWLNYITILLCIPCFDDHLLSRLIPISPVAAQEMTAHAGAVNVLAVVICFLSIQPALNLFSRRQLMNASFDPLHLVNTYGAFGSITRERMEIVIEGTDADPPGESAKWREYEFKGKPGDPGRRPCIVSPYHYKIDWQMWFAAMRPYAADAWFYRLVQKLLEGNRPVVNLLAGNPFPDTPPRYIRAELYRYKFTQPGDKSGRWWTREFAGIYLDPVSLKDFREPPYNPLEP